MEGGDLVAEWESLLTDITERINWSCQKEQDVISELGNEYYNLALFDPRSPRPKQI